VTRRASGPLGVTALVSVDHFLSHVFLLSFPPLFPLIAGTFDVPETRLAVSVTLIYLAQLVCQVPAGELVDRVGGKRVAVGGLALVSASVAAAGFADSYLLVLAFAFVSGVGQSAFHPANYALLDAAGDVSGEGKQFSVHSFGGFLGFAAAPLLVTGIAAYADWRMAFWVVGAAGLVFSLALALALAPVHRGVIARNAGADTGDGDDEGWRPLASLRLLRRPLVAGMFAFFLLATLADTGVQTYTTSFAVNHLDLSTAVGNTALTAFFAVASGAVLVGGWLADRGNVFAIVIGGLVWAAVAVAGGLLLGVSEGPLVVAWALAGAGFGVTLPARDRITNALSGEEDTGKSFGLVYTGLPIGGALAPVVLGVAVSAGTYADAIVGTAVAFFLAAVAVFVFRTRAS